MYSFDVISDIHLNFHVDITLTPDEMDKQINALIKSILPEHPQEVLIIAGDMGHFNEQNYIFLKKMKEYYKHILLVFGNHDFYLVNQDMKDQYHNNSLTKTASMVELASSLEGVHYLEGDTITLNNTTFGGTVMWYDFSYGVDYLGRPKDEIYNKWKGLTNDPRLIKGFGSFYDLDFFKLQKEKLDKIIDQTDVIVTHVGPDWSHIIEGFKGNVGNSSIYFDGREYFDRLQDKMWVFGHSHNRVDYTLRGCRFINTAYGKPEECTGRKIIQIK